MVGRDSDVYLYQQVQSTKMEACTIMNTIRVAMNGYLHTVITETDTRQEDMWLVVHLDGNGEASGDFILDNGMSIERGFV